MPCRDYYDDHPDQYFKDVTEPALKKQISFAESALCQTLEAFASFLYAAKMHTGDPELTLNPLDLINYQEAGIKRTELEKWWKDHKALDAKHREEERLKKLKKSALAKLSSEEKKALGLV